MVRGALQGQVQCHLETVLPRGGDELVEVGDGAEVGCTASWPPSSLPIAHGDPTSPGSAVTALLRPLRCTLPIGCTGGRYTTLKPISAMRGSAAAAVRNVPCTGQPWLSQPPVERGTSHTRRCTGPADDRPRHRTGCREVTNSRKGYCQSRSVTSWDSASAARATGSPGGGGRPPHRAADRGAHAARRWPRAPAAVHPPAGRCSTPSHPARRRAWR